MDIKITLVVIPCMIFSLLSVGCANSDRYEIVLSDQGSLYETFEHGAVAADHPLASHAGAQMLAQGGNAVDAAIASSFALSVVRPESCGIGGGGFMVIHLPNDPTHGKVNTAINYRECAYVGPEYYELTGKSSTIGGAAVAIPGTVTGLLHALEQYGTLDRASVLAPAMKLAQDGFVPDANYINAAQSKIKKFNQHPEMKSEFNLMWNHFLKSGQISSVSSDDGMLKNPGMYNALKLISEQGREGFTQGPVGEAIVRAVRKSGGEMTLEDLNSYQVIEYEPLEKEINGYHFVTMPPPSSGGITMLETLMILEALNYDLSNHQLDDDRATHQFVEALKHAFADRSMYLADPEFVDLPIDDLLDLSIIEERAQMINQDVHPPEYYGTPNLIPIDGGTSHISAIDPWGGAVACTETVNLEFGSLVGVNEFGFILNNEMDDFTTKRGQPNAFGLVQSDRNLPEPGKRPLSSMSPTIVLDDQGQVFAISGASGGPRIITGTLQSLLYAISGNNAGDSMNLPRVHHQWLPNILGAEDEVLELMQARSARGNWNTVRSRNVVGNVQIILRDPDGKGWQAASDRRKGGQPAGI